MYLVIFVLLLSFIVSLVFTFSSSSSIDNVLSIVIVVAFFIVTATFMSLFVFKAITETGEFISNIQPIVQQFINDPEWATTFEKFGIKNDTIPNLVDQSTDYAVNWLESEGYNITEIEESVQRFAFVFPSSSLLLLLSFFPFCSLSPLHSPSSSSSSFFFLASQSPFPPFLIL